MDTIIVDATLTKDGKIEIELPEGWQEGNIRVEITLETLEHDISWNDEPWTEDELDEALDFQPLTLGEILAEGLVGGWEDMGIEDSVEWVLEQRRKRRERRNIWTD